MTRLEALEHLHRTVRAYDEMSVGNVRWADVRAALNALSALPPATEPEPVGEVVAPLRAVSVAVTQPSSETSWAMHVVMSDGSLWDFCGGRWTPFALPSIPEVVGEVEG